MFPTVLAAQTYSACPTPGTRQFDVSAGKLKITREITVLDNPTPVPFIDERYGYADVTEFSSAQNTGTIYANPQTLQMESGCGALRYNFVPRYVNVCEKYYSGYDLKFPQDVGEVFVEVWARFDPAFEPQRPRADSTLCRGTDRGLSAAWHQSGFVFMLGRVTPNAGAFGITLGTGYPYAMRGGAGVPGYMYIADEIPKQLDEDDRHTVNYGTLNMTFVGNRYRNNIQVGNGQYAVEGDTRNRDEFGNALMRFDGNWHRYRFWFKAANGTYPNGASLGVWADDDHLGSLPVQDSLADKLIGLSIGRFLWHQPRKEQYVDFGRVRVWTTNPGWNVCEVYCMGGGLSSPTPNPTEPTPDLSCDPSDPECP